MGIQRLTKHCLPYAERVLLREGQPHIADEVTHIESVVIDGPSLVYLVYSRLLSWRDPTLNILDARPTCNEVSIGVVIYLLQLMCAGVRIDKICFDGALPVLKRETRLARLEKSRRRLELLRSRSQRTSTVINDPNNVSYTGPKELFCSRSMPTRYKDFPEDPFMVSAVFEDLKFRWSKKNISESINHTPPCIFTSLEEYPWAGIVVMVPGEADTECAKIARLNGCSILTNDSDLLVYDLGSLGSVVFLNSVEMGEWNCLDPAESYIKAVRVCPASISSQLGIASLQRFAYELKKAPHLGQNELIQRSRNIPEDILGYHLFIQEYQVDSGPMENTWHHHPQSLDIRLSELFWQYCFEDTFTSGEAPHMCLGILTEDHARKCAWEHGCVYRSLGYSIFNAHCPVGRRFTFIYEHVRRGERIVASRIGLGDSEWIAAEMKSVYDRLRMAQSVFHGHLTSPTAWRAFALCEVFLSRASQVHLPDAAQLRRFFKLGYMGENLGWSDIHLFAEIQAVLYSLRILKQLIEVSGFHADVATKTIAILTELPPLHTLMKSRHEMIREYSNYIADGFEYRFFRLWEQMFDVKPSRTHSSQIQSSPRLSRLNIIPKPIPVEQQAECQKKPSNIYGILSEQ